MLTRNEIIEMRARAIYDAHKNDMGEIWYSATETWNGLSEKAQEGFRLYARAITEADEKAGVLMIVDDEPKKGDLVNSMHKKIPYPPSYWIYKNHCEDHYRWHHKIIQRNDTPAYHCKKEVTND